ncbi:MAG: class II aldolase/adducin family protein [Zoogloeaceae bacterium]|jgi:L-fuculose-phosphate aldolase|nr:class II aldolase/adducin family protein [Zoogloeaceae bacterium]
MNQDDLRQTLVASARAMQTLGLNRGAAGNLSVRCGDGFLITPTGLPYDAMQPADIVPMALDGTWRGARKPSSEWRFHRDIYAARAEAGAIAHAHAPFATALACLRVDIPPFHYMIARFGGACVRCAAYATFGTQALSDAALAALDGRCACLLANHGLLAFGRDLPHALDLAVEFESLCEQYWRALHIAPPVLLSDTEMEAVLEKFKSYGQ